jgi:alpha-L-rhamnosidase
MTSFNHYALGAVVDWLHGSVGGISPAEPGWNVVRVRPVPGGNLMSASVSFDGPLGVVKCEWRLEEDGRFSMDVEIPPNSYGLVTLPCELRRKVSEDVETSRRVGSGKHHFECQYDADDWPPTTLLSNFTHLNGELSIAT